MLYLTYPLNGLLMVALPILLGIYLTHKFKAGWRLWWIGGATFVLSQVGHIPFNWLASEFFLQDFLSGLPHRGQLLTNAIFLGLSAGLWEETARFATYRWWARQARDWQQALLLGAGHGGSEAILLGLLVLVTFFQMLALQGADINSLVPIEQAPQVRALVEGYWTTPWYSTLLGAVERLFALVMHLSLSVLVWQAITSRRLAWLGAAIVWHAFGNAMALLILARWGAYAAEAALAVVAALSLGIVLFFRPAAGLPAADLPAAGMPSSAEAEAGTTPVGDTQYSIDESVEKLDRSRYL